MKRRRRLSDGLADPAGEQKLVRDAVPTCGGRGQTGSRQALLDDAYLFALGPAPATARVDDLDVSD